jgi:hypothetical protein
MNSTEDLDPKIFGYIYRIYNPKLLTIDENGQPIELSYIGRTEKSVATRFMQHKRDANKFQGSEKGGDGKLHAIMWAHGLKDFVSVELDRAYTPEQLSKMETHYQDVYQSIKYGWNKIAASTINRINSEQLEVTVDGVLQKFSSLAQLCTQLGISNSTVTFGISKKKLSLEDAVASALEAKKRTDKKRNTPIIVYRTPYATINDAVRDPKLNKHVLNEKSIRTRLRNGMTLEEAFSTPPIRGRNNELTITTPDGVSHTFPSLAAAHRELGVSYQLPPYSSVITLSKERGLTLEQAFGFASRPWEEKYIELDSLIKNEGYTLVGKKSPYGDPVVLHLTKEVFSTIKEFADSFGYEYTTIAEEIKRGTTPDEILVKRKHHLAKNKGL